MNTTAPSTQETIQKISKRKQKLKGKKGSSASQELQTDDFAFSRRESLRDWEHAS